MHPHLRRGASAPERRSSLKRIHSASSHAHIMELRLQLQIMCKNDLSVDEFVVHLRTLSDHLSVVGEAISDRDLIMYARGGLDSNYNAFISYFMSFDAVSFDKFHN